MKVKPVLRYRTPKYPQKAQIALDPTLLRYVPHRWAKNTAVMTALGMTLSLAGCVRQAPETTAVPTPETAVPTISSSPTETPASGSVAPVFEHGDGFCSYGCVSVVVPYCLTEEEAFEIINSEAETYGGIVFEPGGSEIENVELPQVYIDSWPADINGDEGVAEEGKTGTLSLDGSTNNGISFEFLSRDDMWDWQWVSADEDELVAFLSVANMAYRDTAEFLRQSLTEAELPGAVGVFYDPYSYEDLREVQAQLEEEHTSEDGEEWDYQAIQEGYNAAARALSEENLRAQVRDFIDWLKAEGII